MLHNIDINKMNQLMEENKDVKQIISQLLENHRTTVSTIAHEIRNPLTLVSSSLQVMEIQHPEVKQYSHWKQTMEDVEFMCNLLNELSTFNNGSTLHHSVFSIEKLLKNIAVSFAISLDSEDSSIEFSSSVPSHLGDFTGDKVKLEEVLLNLLRNAKDAVGENGAITLSAQRKKDMLIILCKDNGCGIPADKINTIFTPFVTSKEDGTGLGLSLSKRIIEAHNGTISVDSAPTKGTTFTIKLPI
ncbi:MAG: HAMP domain-containing histidine kinase [Clostridiales bacterium]|nr:HAMP domain-containing histidine kinase [Clostridiales bacterium]